ncbi:MAG: RNA-binding protein [Candidatus Aminicenantes bacterium]|nr:RNA-binding protein [Candidatus Aminicenantes bacterium]
MSSKKLYVGNLNYKMTDEALKAVFSPYGEVTSANVLQGRGFGFVEMAASEAADEARARLNGTDLDGRKIVVNEARPQTLRTREPAS